MEVDFLDSGLSLMVACLTWHGDIQSVPMSPRSATKDAICWGPGFESSTGRAFQVTAPILIDVIRMDEIVESG